MIPTKFPFKSTSAPPEFPGFTGAWCCMKASICKLFLSLNIPIFLALALTIPAVTVDLNSKGDPTARTHSPISKSSESLGNTKSNENGIWKFIIKKNDYSNEEISIKAKINDEILILTYNENDIQKRFKKTNFEFYDDRIVVQKGNSLWRIARKTLGGGVFYTEIYKNNLRKIKNPNLIYPGQVFNIPIKRKKKII